MADRRADLVNRRAIVTASGASLIAPLIAGQAHAQTASTPAPGDPGDLQNAEEATGKSLLRPRDDGGMAHPSPTVLNDWSNSVLSFRESGDHDSTLSFQRAADAFPGKQVFVPPGDYQIGNVGRLRAAGAGFYGLASHRTVLRAAPGTTGALLFNEQADVQRAAYGHIHDLHFHLDGQDVIAIDLSGCGGFVVERVLCRGGMNKAGAAGSLGKFGAPLNGGSYNNVFKNCSAIYTRQGIIWGENANNNAVWGGSYTNNRIAFDAAPGGSGVGRPMISGPVQIENNDIGVLEGAEDGIYEAWFEGNTNGDFDFTMASKRALLMPGCSTRKTPVPLVNRTNATDLRCLSMDMGYFDIESGLSRVRRIQGKSIRTAPGADATVSVPSGAYTDAFMGPVWIGNNVGIEGINVAGTNSVLAVSIDPSNRLVLRSYNRETESDGDVLIGGGSTVRPIAGSTVDLGAAAAPWKDVHLHGVLKVGGDQVVGARGSAVADATDAASVITQLNALLERLRAHGLIST